ncbi:tetratricopeptide repeat protein [Candidatus Poribacteria bacterium]|nr:tetratricopeptide repeat protein [Candidatus Poribacteria bacterium]
MTSDMDSRFRGNDIGDQVDRLVPLLFIIGLVFLSNLNALTAGFVWDDRALIIDNALIKRPDSILLFFKQPFLGMYYRPVVMISFAVEYAIWGLRPFGFHLTNLLLHAANALLVFGLLKDVTRNRQTALLAALLFAAHPAHKGVVAVPDRTGVLSAFFMLMSLFLYVKHRYLTNASRPENFSRLLDAEGAVPPRRDTPTKGHLGCRIWGRGTNRGPLLLFAASVISAGLGFFSKEEVIALPLVIVLVDVLILEEGILNPSRCAKDGAVANLLAQSGREQDGDTVRKGDPVSRPFRTLTIRLQNLRSNVLRCIPFFLVAAIYLWVRAHVVGAGSGGLVSAFLIEPARRLITIPAVLADYLLLLLFPFKLDYEPRTALATSIFEPRILISGLFLLALFASIPHLARKNRGALFGILWYLIVFIPMSNILPIYPEAADSILFTPIHFLYLPSIGVFLLAAKGMGWILRAVSRERRAAILPFCFVLFAFSILSASRNAVWKDEVSLYRYILGMHPENHRMHANLGNVYLERGQVDAAIAELDCAVAFAPDVAWYRNSLALAYQAKGQPEKATRQFLESLRLNPGSEMVYTNLSAVYRSQGRLPEAISAGKKAIMLNPSSAAAHVNLALTYKDAGAFAEAEQQFATALRLDPGSPEAHNGLGIVYASQRNYREAREEWETALRLRPDMPEARENLERLKAMGL